MDALPGDTTYTAFSISCEGDEVIFRIHGTTADYRNDDGQVDGSGNDTGNDYASPTPTVTGSAVLELDPDLADGLMLAYGQDVTLNSVLVSGYSYISTVALTIQNCVRCSMRDARFDTPVFDQSYSSGVPLLIRNSSITLDSVAFTGLGWLDTLSGGSRGAIHMLDSNVTLRNVSFTNSKFISPALSADGGWLRAEGCSWQDITVQTTQGSFVAASSGAQLALAGWAIWNVMGNVGLRLTDGSTVEVADLSLLWLEVLNGSVAVVVNVSFTDADAGGGLSGWARPALRFVNSSGSVSGCSFRGVSVFDDDSPPAVVLDAVNSEVNVTDCTFDQVTWSSSSSSSSSALPLSPASPPSDNGSSSSYHSQESQVLRVASGGLLRVRDTRFSRIGGCGTAIRATDGGSAVLERVNFTDTDLTSATGERRAVVVVSDGALDARECLWSRINVGTSTSGAALDASGAATVVTLLDCNFTDITVPLSPAVQVRGLGAEGRVSVTGCAWRGVTANYALRLVNVAGGVAVNQSQFAGCRCGGAADEARAPVGLTNCPGDSSGGGGAEPVLLSGLEFFNNTGQTGGGVLVSQSIVTIRDSTFRNNSGSYRGGGAIFNQDNSTLELVGCLFIANQVGGTSGGGAVYTAPGARLAVRSSTFVSNSAPDGRGGALAVVRGSLSVADDCTFSSNTADRGGAVYCDGCEDARLVGSSFLANTAQKYGGAVLTASGGSITMADCVLTGNSAARGGALCAGCDAAAGGGAAAIASRIDFNASTDAISRAALLRALDAAFNASLVRLDGCTFATNACSGTTDASTGGGVHIGDVGPGGAFVRGCSFVGNSCPNGGALAVDGGSGGAARGAHVVMVTSSAFRANHGAARGGAVFLLDAAGGAVQYGFFFENTFKANNARLFGGGIDVRMGWALDLLSNSFTANGNADTPLDGGALFLSDCRSLPINNTASTINVVSWRNTYTDNTANRGGALFAGACNVSSLEDRYLGNRAGDGGGALMALNTDQQPLSTLMMSSVYAEGNTAQASGGAVLTSQQGVAILNSVFVNNSARVAGGALAAMEASPAALLVLERNTDPYYSGAEYAFLRAVVIGTTFDGNSADTGGGAIYADTSLLQVEACTFANNVAGDGIPNDEWSDSGGAIAAAACFGLSEVSSTNFTGNRASGGPGGAVVLTACSFVFTNSTFDCNACSTYGGAVAAGNRRNANSTSYTTPTLTALSCNFSGNAAQLYDGGALLGRDMNASVFVSVFRGNAAGRNGGAVAFLDNIGSGLRACKLEANRAVQFGGGAYAVANSLLSLQDSAFADNVALLSGGGLSAVGCTCVLMARSSFSANYAGVSGGAMQLQPATSSASSTSTSSSVFAALSYGDAGSDSAGGIGSGAGEGTCAAATGQLQAVNYLQDAGVDIDRPCISHFLRQVNAFTSPRGRELLGLAEAAVLSYNATVSYGGSGGGNGAFGRGGVLLPTPSVSGPAQFFGYDLTVVLATPSSVTLAAGSALALADWAQLRLQADTDADADAGAGGGAAAAATRLHFAGERLEEVRVEGAVVRLATGSAITRLRPDTMLLPAGTTASLTGDTLFVGTDVMPYSPSDDLPVLSSVLSYRAVVTPADGTGAGTGGSGSGVRVADWNRWVLRISRVAGSAVLLDAFTGVTRSLAAGATIAVANGSPLMGHSADTISLAPGGTGTGSGSGGGEGDGQISISVLQGGAWRLGNGAALATGGSRPAISIVPAAANSSVQLAPGSGLSVESWLPYTIRFRSQDNVTRLEYPARGAKTDLGPGVEIALRAGSVVLTPPSSGLGGLLARGAVLRIQGTSWEATSGTAATAASGSTSSVTLSPGSGNIAMGVVLPAGSTIVTSDNTTSVAVQDWNRHVLWAGPMGTILYDTKSDSLDMLPDMATVVVSRGTPLVLYGGTTVLSANRALAIGAGGWSLNSEDGNTGSSSTTNTTTTISLANSTMALTAILAKGCTVTLANGTLVALADWYRFLLVGSRAGSQLYDTASDAATPLPAGTRVMLAKGSALLQHDSFSEVLAAATKLTVQKEGLLLGDRALPAPGPWQVLVLPAEGSSLSYTGNSTSTSVIVMDGADVPSRYVPWVGLNGSYMYDSALLATFALAPGSSLRLSPASSLVLHDSCTTVLGAETNLTVAPGGVWVLSNGTTLAVGGGDTVGLSASPTGDSRILYDNSSWVLDVSDPQRYSLQAGRNGTTLYDARIDVSYLLADGSKLDLGPDSSTFVRNAEPRRMGAQQTLTVEAGGRLWRMGDGSVVDPGDGVGASDEFEAYLHTPGAESLPGELGRLCSVDLMAASYVTDPYGYDADAAQAYLSSLTQSDDFTNASLYGTFARLAYGYGADADVSGYNAALLMPSASVAWDPLGRPAAATVTCAVTSTRGATAGATGAAAALARGVSMLQIGLTLTDNVAGSAGGGIYYDGGQGSVLMDGCQVENNTVLNGDGGGLGLYQSDDQREMQLQVYVVSSRFSSNTAAVGSGGAVSLRANKIHQQFVFMNTTLDGNLASSGGGLALSRRVSVLLNDSLVQDNRADVAAVAVAAAASSESSNYGNGGGIMASGCNELQITSDSRLLRNAATGRGGGLAAYACAVVLLNDSRVAANAAQSAGGVYVWSDLPVAGSAREGDVGGSIAVAARCNITNNTALDGNATDDQLEGIGGGFLLRGHVSTLLADSYFEDNVADSQGGSIFIESVCDLTANSSFLVREMEAPTAFDSATSLLAGTVSSLQWPRPKGCWGTVVYLPHFYNNEAARSGGALFSSHPEALSLVCDENAGSSNNGSSFDPSSSSASSSSPPSAPSAPSSSPPSDSPLALNYTSFNESALADQVLLAMKKASYQVLDNQIVQKCYREEIQRIYNRSLAQLQLSGTELSTLGISNNSALGYGYLIAIVPSKLQVVNVTWSGNTSNVATTDTTSSDAQQQQQQQQQRRRRRRQLQTAANAVSGGSGSDSGGSSSGDGSNSFLQLPSMAEQPLFSVTPGLVYDKETQGNRSVLNYHITTYSNKPMDLPILLLDALDQVASENTTLRQAQVRARLTEASNGCKAELLGGYEGTARNGTAMMVGMRLRALKGENYSIEFRVEDAIIQGTVEPLVVNVSVPACSLGEIPRDDGYLCQKCDQRSFSLWQDIEPLVNCTYPDLADIICYPCPDGAECLGGAVMVPRQGFWHSAANSTFMNACPNPDACRDGDDDAQDALVACQQWWYSRPQGFDYQAFVDSVLAAGPDGDLLADLNATGDASALCVLWGLPYDHPASYSQKQCEPGYTGNLCAVCAPVDGQLYANGGDFECQACFSRAASIAIAVLGFVANVATVLVTILLTFMTDYTEEEELGMGDLLKVLIVHMQFFVIVTRLNISWPPSISFVTSLLSACTGAMSRVYAPSCLLDPSASPADYATVDQLVAIITPLLTTLCAAALWMIIRLILFKFHNTQPREQKLDMRTIDEYKADRSRRVAEKRRIRESKIIRDVLPEESARGTATSVYGMYDFDAYSDLRASEFIPGAEGLGGVGGGVSGDGVGVGVSDPPDGDGAGVDVDVDGGVDAGAVDARGVGVGAGGQISVSELARLLSPPRQGETYGEDEVADISTVHVGLPIQEEADEAEGEEMEGRRRRRLYDSTNTERKPAVRQIQKDIEAASEAEGGVHDDHDSDGLFNTAGGGGAAGVGRRTKAFLPLPPLESELSPVTSPRLAKTPAQSPPAPPPAPPAPPAPPPPPAPAPPSALARSTDGGGGGGRNFHDGGGGGGGTSRASTASGSGAPTAVATITTRSPTASPVLYATPSVTPPSPLPDELQAPPSSPFSTAQVPRGPSRRSPGGSRRVLPARQSVDGAAAAAAAAAVATAATDIDSHAATPPRPPPPPLPGLSISPVTSLARAMRTYSGDRRPAGAGSEGGVGQATPAPRASLTVRPVVPNPSPRPSQTTLPVNGGSGAETGPGGGDFERADPRGDFASGGSATAGGRAGAGGRGASREDSAREGGSGGDSGGGGGNGGGNGDRRTSSFLRRKLVQGSKWFRTFFTYDEEAAEEEGQVRWASLANIHRTMAWWRQMLLVVMIACFVLYPAWAQATLQIFACYYLDDGTGYYPDFQLAQWGKGYWILNMNQECYLGDHARIWVPLGIVCIFVICIGIPFLTFMVTWTHRTALRTVHVAQTYGFLYQRYDYEDFYWWEAAMQFQTLMLVVVDVFGRVLVVYQQAVLLMLALMVIMWSNMYFQPLKHKLLERMSSLSLAVLSFTVALGLFFVPPADRKDPVTGAVAAAIGALIVAMNAALLIYFVYVMWTQGREAINRSVATARQRVLTATSKVQLGITAVRQHVSSASQNLRSVTSLSLSMVWDKVHVRRRATGQSMP